MAKASCEGYQIQGAGLGEGSIRSGVHGCIHRGLDGVRKEACGGIGQKSSIALYRAVPVSQSSHKGICSREASSMLLIDGTREGYERRCSGIQWLDC